MKIAITKDGDNVSKHFGHAKGYEIVVIEGESVISTEYIENPGHRPGFLPKFLRDLGVQAVISHGMGDNARALFASYEIKVYTCVEGSIDEAVEKFIAGELIENDRNCKHEHHH